MANINDLRAEELSSLVDSFQSKFLIIKTNLEGQFTYINQKFCDTTRYSEKELLNQSISLLNSGFHRKPYFEKIWKTLLSGSPWKGKFRNKTKDGAFFWIDSYIFPLICEGEIKEFISFSEVVNNDHLINELDPNLKKEESVNYLDFYKYVTDSLGVGVVTCTHEGVITDFNKKSEELLGYSAEEIVGKVSPAIWHDQDEIIKKSKELSQEFGVEIEPGFETFICYSRHGLKNESEWTYVHKDGHRFPVWLVITPLKNERGKIIGFTGLAHDLTDIRRLEKEVESQKLLAQRNEKLASVGLLSAGVGHEINNPLAIIKGYIDHLVRSYDEQMNPEDVKRYLTKINVATERISRIVQGLRSFTRTDNDEMTEFNPFDSVNEILDLVEEIYLREGIKINCLVEADKNALVNGYKGNFNQVIMNLLENSRNAILNNSEKIIDLSFKTINGNYEISVTDNGRGIPEEIKSKIFDPFFTTKEVNEGTGLGLALVHNFIKDMDGELQVESEVGKGTTFTIVLPLFNKPKKNRYILIVDDEPEIREILEDLLKGMNFNVFAVENGQLALDEYIDNQEKYDLIISDIQMPKMDGLTLLKELREKKNIKQPKFVFCTGGVNTNLESCSKQLGNLMDGYFYKPFNYEIIYNIVHKCLEEVTQ